MEVRIVGAHCCESVETKLTCMVLDGILALDAGGLTTNLCFAAQERIRAILLTHQHLDHVKGIGTIGYFNGLLIDSGLKDTPKHVYAIPSVLKNLSTDLLNNRTFPDFTTWPSVEKPALQFHPVESYKESTIEGYRVLPLPVNHTVPAVGYYVTAPDGESLFFTGDSGPGWVKRTYEYITPDLIITELSGTNHHTETAIKIGHLTPQLLKQELSEFHHYKGYLSPVILIHLTPLIEEEIRQEVEEVASELGANIRLGREGMRISV